MAYVLGESGDVEEREVLEGSWDKNGSASMVLWYRGAQYTRKVPKTGLVTHSEAAALLKVRRESVWRWVQAGKLKGYKVRGANVVSVAELRQFGMTNGYLVPRS